MRALVTGASGLLGSTLRRRLALDDSHEVLGADLIAMPPDVEAADLSDPALARRLVARVRPDIVFHCAGAVGGTSPEALDATLQRPTRAVLDAVCTEAPSAVVVVPGSAAEYGTLAAGIDCFSEDDVSAPVGEYGRAKARQTALALGYAERGVDVRVARVFNLLGPRIGAGFLIGRVAGELHDVAMGTRPPVLELGALASVRDYVDIRDACDALITVALRGQPGRVYNVCSEHGRTAREVVTALLQASGLEVSFTETAAGSERTGLDASVGCARRITDECGWAPRISFEDSVRDTVEAPWNA